MSSAAEATHSIPLEQQEQVSEGAQNSFIVEGKYLRSEETATTLTITILTRDQIKLSFLLTDRTKVLTARGEPTKYNIWTLRNPTIAKPFCILTIAYRVREDIAHVYEVKIGGREH